MKLEICGVFLDGLNGRLEMAEEWVNFKISKNPKNGEKKRRKMYRASDGGGRYEGADKHVTVLEGKEVGKGTDDIFKEIRWNQPKFCGKHWRYKNLTEPKAGKNTPWSIMIQLPKVKGENLKYGERKTTGYTEQFSGWQLTSQQKKQARKFWSVRFSAEV